ncbi:MAG: DUF4350 domain-containing protein [Deltaproteobacteria bacterium]|nr:DUF4350 domain-containing protein [Deltaproteobacteria bacterium]
MKAIILLASLFLLSLSGHAASAEIYFDTSHRVIFHPSSEQHLGLKKFVSLFRENGDHVEIGDYPLGILDTGTVDVLVIPGSMAPYSPEEIDLVEKFVNDGGRLLVLLHIAPPLARLTERFGIILSNAVISENENKINGRSQDFFVKDMASHEITRDVSMIAFYGSWGLLAEGKGKVLAFTSENAYADFNRNRRFDHGEPRAKMGVVAVSDHGKGKVVVVADDAPLANAFIDVGDNRKFAGNIVNWLSMQISR